MRTFGHPKIFGEVFGQGSQQQTLGQYLASIKAFGLIFLGPLRELSGTDAIDLSPEQDNWAYRNAGMLNKSTFLTNEPCPQWIPANNDYLSGPAAFLSNFNLDEYCVLVFAQVRDISVWSDATNRQLFEMNLDGSNRSYCRKTTTTNQLQFGHIAGGTTEVVSTTLATTSWFMVTARTSNQNDEYKAFVNGVQVGASQTGLGDAAGDITTAIIGASNVVGGAVWDGYEAYAAIWSPPSGFDPGTDDAFDYLPTDEEIVSIYNFLAV